MSEITITEASTVPQIKEYLDSQEIDHKEAKNKTELLALAGIDVEVKKPTKKEKYSQSECKEMAKDYFKNHKDLEVLYFTEDGVAFFKKNNAEAHSKGKIFKIEK